MTTAAMKKIGVLTSGGDAPGMNACIRSITRTAIYHDLEVVGFRWGYKGVLEMDFRPLGSRSVSNIIQRGGTILGSGSPSAACSARTDCGGYQVGLRTLETTRARPSGVSQSMRPILIG